MKPLCLLFSILFFTNKLCGQQSAKQATHQRVLRGLLRGNDVPAANMRTTSGTTMERVIAQSKRDNTLLSMVDSVNLTYSLMRTSIYDYNDMIFPYNYPYSASPMFNYEGVFTRPQVLYDTFRHWEVDPNTLVYGYYETAYAAYNASSDMTGYLNLFVDSAINPNVLFVNRFNSVNNIDSGYWFNYIMGVPDSTFRQFFTYNTSNLLTKDSTYERHLGVWRLVSKTFYTYDGSNNLVQIDNYANTTDTSFTLALPEQLKYVNTYDGSHRLLTVASSFNDDDSLLPYIKDTFAYTGTYTYHTAWREYQMDPINHYWAPMFNMTKLTNLSGRPDTVYIEGFDSLTNSWTPQTLDVVYYNSYNDPDTLQDFEYNFTAYPSSPSFTTVYYYNTFTGTTEAPVTATEGPVTVFPNPASGFITVSTSAIQAREPVSIYLINELGQIVVKQVVSWQNPETIDVKNIAPGRYEIVLANSGGTILGRQPMIKCE